MCLSTITESSHLPGVKLFLEREEVLNLPELQKRSLVTFVTSKNAHSIKCLYFKR